MNKYEQLITLIEKRIETICVSTTNIKPTFDLLNEKSNKLNEEKQNLLRQVSAQANLVNTNYNKESEKMRNEFKSFLETSVLTFLTFLIMVFALVWDINNFAKIDILNKIYLAIATFGSGIMTLICGLHAKEHWDNSQTLSFESSKITENDLNKYRELKNNAEKRITEIDLEIEKISQEMNLLISNYETLRCDIDQWLTWLKIIETEYRMLKCDTKDEKVLDTYFDYSAAAPEALKLIESSDEKEFEQSQKRTLKKDNN